MANTTTGRALVLGSLAFDYIMSSPEDYYDSLSIKHDTKEVQGSFLSVKKLVSFGGTAGNIAYNMALLGGRPIVAGYVGDDFRSLAYETHLAKQGVDLRLECISDDSTASCYIFNDNRKNQIIVFHGGALNKNELIDLTKVIKMEDEVKIAINAPNNMVGMVKFSKQLKTLGIPSIFDPGQVINALTPEQFKEILTNSTAFISNEHEYQAVNKRFGIDLSEITDNFDWIITTKGSQGSIVNERGKTTEIPLSKARSVQDPTGAGDAFRGALLYGLARGLDVVHAARLGAVMGSINVEHVGGQSYVLDKDDFTRRYKETFKEDPAV